MQRCSDNSTRQEDRSNYNVKRILLNASKEYCFEKKLQGDMFKLLIANYKETVASRQPIMKDIPTMTIHFILPFHAKCLGLH